MSDLHKVGKISNIFDNMKCFKIRKNDNRYLEINLLNLYTRKHESNKNWIDCFYWTI